jgi:hypothetical protein
VAYVVKKLAKTQQLGLPVRLPLLHSQLSSRDIQTHGAWGLLEFTDFDLVIRSEDGSLDNTAVKAWTETLPQVGRMLSCEPRSEPKLKQWIRDAGFTIIVIKIYKLAIGP